MKNPIIFGWAIKICPFRFEQKPTKKKMNLKALLKWKEGWKGMERQNRKWKANKINKNRQRKKKQLKILPER